MAQHVDFDGLGVIEFPDEMGQDDIAKVLRERGDEIRQRFGVSPEPQSKDFNRAIMADAPDANPLKGPANPPPLIGKDPGIAPFDGVKPFNFVPQSEVNKPEEAKIDQDNVRKIHAYYDDLRDLAGGQDEKVAAIEQARTAALKGQGVGVIDFLSTAKAPRLEAGDLKTLGLGDTASKVAAGLQNAVAGSVDFFTSPEGMAVLGSGNMPEALRRAVSAGFAIDMAKSEPQLLVDLAKAWKDGDTQKATELAVNAGLNVAFMKESAKHAMTPEATLHAEAMAKGLARNIENPALFADKIEMPTQFEQSRQAMVERVRDIQPPAPELDNGLGEADPNVKFGHELKVKNPPIVPETLPEPYQTVTEEIRKAKAQTIAQIQKLFPRSELSREKARELRNMVWGEPAPDPIAPAVRETLPLAAKAVDDLSKEVKPNEAVKDIPKSEPVSPMPTAPALPKEVINEIKKNPVEGIKKTSDKAAKPDEVASGSGSQPNAEGIPGLPPKGNAVIENAPPIETVGNAGRPGAVADQAAAQKAAEEIKPPATPLEAEWRRLKTEAPDSMVAVRLGDFYEFFFDDAEKSAKALNIALTKRNNMAMTGVPVHAAESYFAALRKKGFKVAVADVDKPGGKRKIVQQEPAPEKPGESSNIPSSEESKRLDDLTEQSKAKLAKLSENQISQLGIDVGRRRAGREDILSNVHPDDLAEALDAIKLPKAEAVPKGVNIPADQWDEMARLNTKQQLEKYGTTRAKEMERAALEAQAKAEEERAKPKREVKPKVNEPFATIGDYEFGLTKGGLPERPDMYGVGIRRIGSKADFESGGYGYHTKPETLIERWAAKEGHQPIDYQNAFAEKIAKKVIEEQAKKKAEAEAKDAEEKAKAEAAVKANREYSEAVKQVKLPTGKAESITIKATNGDPFPIEGTRYGEFMIHRRIGYDKKPKEFKVTHVKSGLSVAGDGFQTKAAALDYLRAIKHAEVKTDFTKAEDLTPKEMEHFRQLAMYWVAETGPVPDYFKAKSEPSVKPTVHAMAASVPPAPAPAAPSAPAAKLTLPAPWPVAKPTGGLPFASTMVQALKSIRSVLAPQNLGHDARIFSLILRENNAQMALDLVRADAVLSDYRKLFDKTPVPKDWTYDPAQPLPNNFAVIDALERNRSALPTELQSLAQRFDDEFAWRIAEVQKFNPDALQKLIANYFPHMWEQPEKGAASFMAEVAARSPLHGSKAFLKQRTIDFFHEGLARGLKPISDNPVDLLLAKLHQMDKYIMAQRTLTEAKAAGMYKYLSLGRDMPDGWVTVKDPAFTVFAPPTVTVREAFDLGIRNGLLDFIKKMGFTHERTTKLGKVNVWGQYSTGGKIESKYGAPDFVIMHEIGHGLDERYGLYNQLSGTPQLKAELKALADERSAGQKTSAKFKQYAQDPAEQMANVVHAYMYAPELMDKVAPNVKKAFENVIRANPELDDLNKIKPSLSLATGQSQFPLAGPVLAGHWIMPEGPAQVLTNYLSPGLQRFMAFRTLRAGANILNAAQLGLSGFHVGFTSLDASISSVAVGLHYLLEGKGITGASKILTAPFAPLLNYFTGKAVQDRMIDPKAKGVKVLGMQFSLSPKIEAELSQVAKLAVKGGLRATVDPFWQTTFTRNMVRAFHEGGAMKLGEAAARLPFALVEQSMRPISEFLVPRQKLGVFAQLAHFEMDRLGPGASVEAVRDAMAKAADTTEDRMGQMTYDNLFYHRIIKDLALIGFRAYGWQLGKYRALAGAVTDTAKAVTGKGEITNRMLYPMALVMVTGAIGGIMNYLLSGKPPEEAKDLFFPKNGQKDASGKEQRYALPTYLKDLASDWKDFPNGAKMAGSFYHKLNPGIAMGVDMLRNRDFYDTEIRHPDDPAWQQLSDEVEYIGKSFLPFSVSGYNKLGETDTPEIQRLLPFIGIVPAKKSITMTPAESKSAEIMQAMMPAGSRTKEQFEKSQFKSKLLRDIQANETDGRQKIQTAIQGGAITPQEGQQILARKELTPLQYQIKKMPAEKAMQVWDLMDDKEKDSARALLRIKVAGSTAIKPEQKKEWLEILK